MTPYTFSLKDAKRLRVDNTSSRRTLRFYGKNIYPSALLADSLGLDSGSHVAITLDEDRPTNIFIRKADDADDNECTQTATVAYDCKRKGTYVFSSVAVVRHILELVGADKSVTMYVSPRPTTIEGKMYYRILTETPIAAL